MAQLSGSEPISAANLAAVLEGGALGGETELYSDKGNMAQTVTLSEPMEDFDVLRVTVAHGSSNMPRCYSTVEFFPGDIVTGVQFVDVDDGNVSVSTLRGGGTTLRTELNMSYIGKIVRVTGIRTGGGAAPS